MARIKAEIGSDNIFADLGIENPDEYLEKAKLAIRINELVRELKLTQRQAADRLEIDQSKVSRLKRGLLDGFSIQRLMRFLRLLGEPTEIKPKAKTCAVVPELGSRLIGSIATSNRIIYRSIDEAVLSLIGGLYEHQAEPLELPEEWRTAPAELIAYTQTQNRRIER